MKKFTFFKFYRSHFGSKYFKIMEKEIFKPEVKWRFNNNIKNIFINDLRRIRIDKKIFTMLINKINKLINEKDLIVRYGNNIKKTLDIFYDKDIVDIQINFWHENNPENKIKIRCYNYGLIGDRRIVFQDFSHNNPYVNGYYELYGEHTTDSDEDDSFIYIKEVINSTFEYTYYHPPMIEEIANKWLYFLDEFTNMGLIMYTDPLNNDICRSCYNFTINEFFLLIISI